MNIEQMIRKSSLFMKGMEEDMKEALHIIKANPLFIKKIQRETNQQIQKIRRETDQKIQKMRKETGRKIAEACRKIKELEQTAKQEADRRAQEAARWNSAKEGSLEDKYGKLQAPLMGGGLMRLLSKRGIEIDRVMSEYPGAMRENGIRRSFGLIALNGKKIVVVETENSLSKRKPINS